MRSACALPFCLPNLALPAPGRVVAARRAGPPRNRSARRGLSPTADMPAVAPAFLQKNGHLLEPVRRQAVTAMTALADGSLSEADFAAWLRRWTRRWLRREMRPLHHEPSPGAPDHPCR